jgi:DNA primase
MIVDDDGFLELLIENNIRHERRGHEIWYQCPIPGHSNDDVNYSASYSLKTGYANCFVHGGGIANIIACIKGVSYSDAKKIKEQLNKGMEDQRIKSEIEDFHIGGNETFASEAKLKEYCKIINKEYTFRNFTNQEHVVRKFEIGYDKNSSRLTFPLRDASGKLILIFKRSAIEENPRYIIEPKNSEKSNYVFGINLCKNPEHIIIVEGAKSVIRSFDKGVENVVSIMGSKPSKKQMEIILKKTGVIYAALDDDTSGKIGTEMLKKYSDEYSFELKIFKHPDPTIEEIEGAFRRDFAEYTVKEIEYGISEAYNYCSIGDFDV